MISYKALSIALAACAAFILSAPLSAQIAFCPDSIEVVVHRGANHLAPENTIASALVALEHGAKWIEVDVRKSKDNILYNLHDATLERTTNGWGLIQDALSTDIEKLDAGSWFSPQYAGTHVPRIAEMLDALQGKAYVFFDVKRGTSVADLVALVREKGFEEKSFFWFADPKMLDEFVVLAPEMKVKVNASNIEGLEKWMQVCRPSYVEIAVQNITPPFREFCKAHGIKIMAAIQNASEEEYKKAIEAQPDLVNLDRPELFEEILQQYSTQKTTK